MASFTVKKKELANVIKAISTILEEAAFQVKNDSIVFQGADARHISLMNVELKEFVSFDVPEAVTFGVRVDEVKKVVARFKDTVKIDITDKVRVSEGAKVYEISIIDVHTNDMPLPPIPFTCKITMSKDELVTALKDVQVSSSFVAIEAADKVVFSGRGDNAAVTTEPIVEREGNGHGNYSLEFLLPVVEAVDVDEATLELGAKTPIKVTLGNIQYYLAPRVND